MMVSHLLWMLDHGVMLVLLLNYSSLFYNYNYYFVSFLLNVRAPYLACNEVEHVGKCMDLMLE